MKDSQCYQRKHVWSSIDTLEAASMPRHYLVHNIPHRAEYNTILPSSKALHFTSLRDRWQFIPQTGYKYECINLVHLPQGSLTDVVGEVQPSSRPF